jgi:REP element-mobilizing transposase RayT
MPPAYDNPQDYRRGRHMVSALRIHLVFVTRERHIMHGNFLSPSCFAASCRGAPLNIIRQYIEQQGIRLKQLPG